MSKLKLLASHAPEAMQAFVAFDKAALAEGAIPGKYKELIALGVAFTAQCPLYRHPCQQGTGTGASDQEIAEFRSRQRCERVGR